MSAIHHSDGLNMSKSKAKAKFNKFNKFRGHLRPILLKNSKNQQDKIFAGIDFLQRSYLILIQGVMRWSVPRD